MLFTLEGHDLRKKILEVNFIFHKISETSDSHMVQSMGYELQNSIKHIWVKLFCLLSREQLKNELLW